MSRLSSRNTRSASISRARDGTGSLLERIEKGQAKQISVALDWKDEQLTVALHSDGRDLPPDGELTSGLRRGERVALLHGTWEQGVRPDGTVSLQVTVPIRPAPTLIS